MRFGPGKMLAGNALVYYGEKQLRDEIVAEHSKAVPRFLPLRMPKTPAKTHKTLPKTRGEAQHFSTGLGARTV